MHWPAVAADQHHVEAQIECREVGPALEETQGGALNTLLLEGCQGFGRRLRPPSCLHLDEGEDASPTRDDVDLSQGRAKISRKDTPAQ